MAATNAGAAPMPTPARSTPERDAPPLAAYRVDAKVSPYLLISPFFILFASSGSSRCSTPRVSR